MSPRSPAPPQTLEEVCQETRGISSQLQENNVTLQRRIEELREVCARGLQHKALEEWKSQCSELQKQVEKLKRENKELQMKHIATQSLSPGQSIRPGSWIEQKLQARLNQALKEKDAILSEKLELEKEKQSLQSQLEELKMTATSLAEKHITEELSPRILELESTNQLLQTQLCTEREQQRESFKDCTEQLSAVRQELVSSEQNAKWLSNQLGEVQAELATYKTKYQDDQKMHKVELDSLQADLATSTAHVQDLQQKHQKELQELQAKLDTSQASQQGLREQYEKQLDTALATSWDKEQQLHSDYKKELEEKQKELEITMKELSQQQLATVAVNSEREALANEISELNEELKVREDQLHRAGEETEHMRELEAEVVELKAIRTQLSQDVALHYAQEQRLREKVVELQTHINEQQRQMVTEMEQEEQAFNMPPPVATPRDPAVVYRARDHGNVWTAGPSFVVHPHSGSGHCPICGRSGFLTIADLELHSAKCTDFEQTDK
ncbi:hypothetical protein EMCRGX_G006162 [Ephydatia muelleri]